MSSTGAHFPPIMVKFKNILDLPEAQTNLLIHAFIRPEDMIALPEHIFVETHFVFSKPTDAEIVVVGKKAYLKKRQSTADANDTGWRNSMVNGGAKTKIVGGALAMKDCGTMTDSENPRRNRCLQTSMMGTQSLGIQCSIDGDYDVDEAIAVAPQSVEGHNDELDFATFVCEKTFLHPNGKVECLVCGEVRLKLKSLESHLRLHWGPKALCSRCGILVEHRTQLRSHGCQAKRRRRSRSRCPHYRCDFEALSTLELYDHINEHLSNRFYKCRVCRKTFCSAIRLKQHRSLHEKLQQRAIRLRIPYDKCELQTADSRRCRVPGRTIYSENGPRALRIAQRTSDIRYPRRCGLCLKRCGNSFQFRMHRRRCLRAYRVRMVSCQT